MEDLLKWIGVGLPSFLTIAAVGYFFNRVDRKISARVATSGNPVFEGSKAYRWLMRFGFLFCCGMLILSLISTKSVGEFLLLSSPILLLGLGCGIEGLIAPLRDRVVVTDDAIEFHRWYNRKPKTVLKEDIHLVVVANMSYTIMNHDKKTILRATAKYERSGELTGILYDLAHDKPGK